MFRLLLILFFSLTLFSPGCSSPSSAPEESIESNSFEFEVPRRWELVDEREGDTLYQANLRNNEGPGRMLIGRLALKSEVSEVDAYLFKLHGDLVKRIQGQADFAPFSEDRLGWANGVVGYRTRMRGELGREVVIIEGITLSDGQNAYFNYGLFPEAVYQEGQRAYARVLSSFSPIRGQTRVMDRGMDIAQSEDVAGGDGASSHEDYNPPKTHLGMAAWGASRDDIIQTAGTPPRKGSNAIGYSCRFLNLSDCTVIYIFEFGQLTHGGFLLERTFEEPQEYVKRYLQLTKQLTGEFGRPLQSSAIWSNPKYRSEGSQWGRALSEGHVIFGTVWQMGPAKVIHSLRRSEAGAYEHRILMSNDELREDLQRESSVASRDE